MKILLFLILLLPFSILAQDFALNQLNNSSRHHEWVKIKSNGRQINCFVAFPETSSNVTAVIVIHENRGLTDWVRSMTDQLAAEGYIAIAPDLLSDFSESYSKTDDFASSDDARNAIYELKPEQVMSDLDAVYEYLINTPAVNEKIAVMGFCWGGSQTFKYATHNPEIDAALVFYGTGPDDLKAIQDIKAPVYGFYGGDDQRVNATISTSEKLMKEAGKTYKYEVYPGAGHAYMRSGDDPEGSAANKDAKRKSMERLKQILDGI